MSFAATGFAIGGPLGVIASHVAYDAVTNVATAGIEKGTDVALEKIAELYGADTANAAQNLIEKGLLVLGGSAAFKGVKGIARNGKGAAARPGEVPSSQTRPNAANVETGAVNQGPYNPRAIEEHLRSTLQPGETMTSSTLPRANQKNVKLAGQRHPETGVVYSERGMPIFDDIAVFDTIISKQLSLLPKERLHMKEATSILKNEIISGKISRQIFNEEQLASIMKGSDRIPGLTWHHHETVGRMQLIDFEFHQKTGHVGGMDLWFFGGQK